MSQGASERGRIILEAMGLLLEKRGFPNWSNEGEIKQLESHPAAFEVLIPSALSLWPIGMCARAAFDEYSVHGASWLGTSVWEPTDPQRPLLGVGLMQESAQTWWTVDWMQQNNDPGLIIARLTWHTDPQLLAERLDAFVSAMELNSQGERAASFLRGHINHLYQTAQKQRLLADQLVS